MDSNIEKNALLIIAIVAVSFAAVFIRLSDAPAIAIASWRLVFSVVLIAPFVVGSRRVRSELRSLGKGDLLMLLLSGFMLALHFLFWISSLFLTGVASSVVLVTTAPLFVGLFSLFVLKERVSVLFWLGLLIAAFGCAMIGGRDMLEGGFRLRGDLLSVLGAIAAAGYFLVGARMRKRLSLIAYVFPVYMSSAIILAAVAACSGTPMLGYSRKSFMYFFLLALLCQTIGHSLFNWALRHVKATVVTFAVLGEPVGASVLAMLILREMPRSTEIIGGIMILAGLYIVLSYGSRGLDEEEAGDSFG